MKPRNAGNLCCDLGNEKEGVGIAGEPLDALACLRGSRRIAELAKQGRDSGAVLGARLPDLDYGGGGGGPPGGGTSSSTYVVRRRDAPQPPYHGRASGAPPST